MTQVSSYLHPRLFTGASNAASSLGPSLPFSERENAGFSSLIAVNPWPSSTTQCTIRASKLMLNNIQPNLQHCRAKPGWADYRCVNRWIYSNEQCIQEERKEIRKRTLRKIKDQSGKLASCFCQTWRGATKLKKEAFQDWRVWAKIIQIWTRKVVEEIG